MKKQKSKVAAVLPLKASRGKNLFPRYTSDATFAWVVQDYGERGRDWAELGAAFMEARAKLVGGAYGSRLFNISLFIRRYVARWGFWEPRDLLLLKREHELPPLRGEKGKAPFLMNASGVHNVNRLCGFLDWVLENDPKGRFGEWEDGHFTAIPNCHNPFSRQDYRGLPRCRESDKIALPWKMIVDLKEKIAPGLHFSDWTWAHMRNGKHGGI